MYVISTYSHGSISLDVYIEVIEWLNILNPKVNRNMHVWNFWSHFMTWSSWRIVWCNRLSELLLDKDYYQTNDCWRVFMKKSWIGFSITLICGIDDLIIKVYIRHEIHTIILRRIFGLNQIMLFMTWAYPPKIAVFIYPKVLEKFNMDILYQRHIWSYYT